MAVDTTAEPIRLTFGELEARLSRLHEISSEKRTQFQARLRNFQRLGIPAGVGSGRGKVVHYGVGQVFEMALAIELTQLGLLPERIQQIFFANKYPISEAVERAAASILEKGGFLPDRDRSDENMTITTGSQWFTHDEAEDPVSMFLYFDPTALASLTDIPEKYEDQASATFFYCGPEHMRQNIVRWTAGPHTRRLSMINVTAVIWGLVVRTKPERQKQFCTELERWARELQLSNTFGELNRKLNSMVVNDTPEGLAEHAQALKNMTGLPRDVADALAQRADRILETAELPCTDTGLTGKRISDMTDEELLNEVRMQLIMSGFPKHIANENVRPANEPEEVFTPESLKEWRERQTNGDR